MNAHVSTVLAFATGLGQSDTRAVTLSDGRPNPSQAAGTPYHVIEPKQIMGMLQNPSSVQKDKARWFIPSTYHGPDARSHEAQRQYGTFFWLPVDIDQNNLACDEVLSTIQAVTPETTCLIYSSRSATENNRKWRALLPLKEPLAGADYTETAAAFYDLLEKASEGALIPDRALCRPGQLIYLPNRGEHYDHHVHRANRLILDADHPIIVRREENRARIKAAQEFAQRERKRGARVKPTGGDETPVDHFNQNHAVADLLARYGYKQAGQGGDWRSPMQTSGSYATREFGDHWISLSGSDAAAEIGRATPDGHRFGDAFDLYVHFEKDGDFTKAVRDYANEAGLRDRPSIAQSTRPEDMEPDAIEDGDEGRDGADPEAAEAQSDGPFRVNNKGVWKRIDRMEKETGRITTKWMLVCSELYVRAETRDSDGEDWGRLLEVVDRDGRRKRWAMPMALMAGDGSAIRDRLFSLGLVPSQARDARQALLEYIGSAQPDEKVRCVARIGWSGGAFVLPNQTIGTF